MGLFHTLLHSQQPLCIMLMLKLFWLSGTTRCLLPKLTLKLPNLQLQTALLWIAAASRSQATGVLPSFASLETCQH
jgi:hypothetical protein